MSTDETIRGQLEQTSTATLTTQLFKRGLRNQFMQGVRPLNRSGKPLVGRAFTLRYIPAREDLDRVEVFQDKSHPQRQAVETVPPGQVLVMDCHRDATAASAGGILITRMRVRGVAGVVTDGGLRDSGDIEAMDWPVYAQAPSAPTNLTKHHAVDMQLPIGCGGVPVFPGDWILGDRDGVVVIPQELAAELAPASVEQEHFEDYVMREVEGGATILGLYPPDEEARARYEAWRDKGRDKG